MDDKQFLPEYPEGVSWLMKDPTGEPEVCPFWNKWHDLPVDEDGEQDPKSGVLVNFSAVIPTNISRKELN